MKNSLIEENIKKINLAIEKIIDGLAEIFNVLKITETDEYSELRDMFIIKRRFIEVFDMFLSIFHHLVELKFLRYKEDEKKQSEEVLSLDLFKEMCDKLKNEVFN
ncbi:hypothetical protein CWI38_0436p0030 [Hamiltosporidium tvaerminnensis]|uniref:Uncharacterized protein n=2 Tax=Hamiltosporidium TaxID=1176354 RepID=A0A4Q9LI58_9MICR|nr:hypothetical protein LUQ84_000631 [Hamiltosporidium tvaerminnensis]TBT96770.1 hypothetical protein CWI37_2750p0010 [Hamiltosporidium tvaerminnensis]TBU06911.1 hypothetical protein CWI36_0360p0020 [Hamiltosporidium magnivora]TBU07943.1 hypothetical protein CWI39_0247p0020 [Hamiltosporidium magnivora]TBU13419.1 hypothetical protein CWI38_0436p0030 [Hamiltosporidium tvaerminnensis]